MKKSIFIGFLIALCSCDDGDLQIETIDFDSVSVQTCGAVDLDTKIFFKINGDEALILELQSGILKNEVTADDIVSAVGSQSTLTYRLFSENVSNDYFCSEVPLTAPSVISEILAESGSVIITTVSEDDVAFEHTLKLSDISFVTDTDSRITDLRINEFGSVTTVKTE